MTQHSHRLTKLSHKLWKSLLEPFLWGSPLWMSPFHWVATSVTIPSLNTTVEQQHAIVKVATRSCRNILHLFQEGWEGVAELHTGKLSSPLPSANTHSTAGLYCSKMLESEEPILQLGRWRCMTSNFKSHNIKVDEDVLMYTASKLQCETWWTWERIPREAELLKKHFHRLTFALLSHAVRKVNNSLITTSTPAAENRSGTRWFRITTGAHKINLLRLFISLLGYSFIHQDDARP